MQYRLNKYGNPISILGYGCMRFSRKGAGIDMPKTEAEIRQAIDAGVNYFDTAYIYSGSEAALGEILAKDGLRDKVQIATKLPQYLIRDKKAIERIFGEELTRLQTDHVDYYLMHMLTDVAAWEHLCDLGIREWVDEKKASGAIKNIGFSFHGNTDMFLRILDAYDWDFCQIQYNYMDEVSQAGRKGLQAAAAKGIPVIIMEPLRGGKLVNLLPKEAKDAIAADTKHRSAAEIALTWLWDQPEVTCVLSGMNSTGMIEENCRIASKTEPGSLAEEDFALIERIKSAINAKLKVNCTGCRYCMPCPHGVDIPLTFRCYNEMYTEKRMTGISEYAMTVGLRQSSALPSQCKKCGRCEKHCPQHLPIIKELEKAGKALTPFYVRAALAVLRKVMIKK